MLLRFIEITDEVTGTSEEHIEEFEKLEVMLKKEDTGEYFLELRGDDEFKGVKLVIDFTDVETDEIIKKMKNN